MRPIIALALFLGCATPESPGPEAPPVTAELPPGRYVVLDAAQAVATGRQCSRSAPDITAGWPMTDEDAQAVEARLNELVESSTSGSRLDLVSSVRQYVGAVVDGRQVIYLNAFPASMMATDDDLDLTRPMMVCDGGPNFWGVVFDPETKQFSELDFNGPY
ncbi:MAG: hypothetical protein Rubg2KO_10860 [Rubricoccaceae bacterium]